MIQEDVLHDDLLLGEKDDVRLEENVTEVKADSVSDTLLESQYMGVAVGVLVTVILLLIVVIVFILYRNYLGPDNNTAVYSNNHNIRKNVYSSMFDLEAGPEQVVYGVSRTRTLPLTPTTSEDNYTGSTLSTLAT